MLNWCYTMKKGEIIIANFDLQNADWNLIQKRMQSSNWNCNIRRVPRWMGTTSPNIIIVIIEGHV